MFTTYYTQLGPKIKNAPDLLKFGTFEYPISILISKIIFYQIFTNC